LPAKSKSQNNSDKKICHIIEHHAAGMMAHFEVIGSNTSNKEIDFIKTHHHH